MQTKMKDVGLQKYYKYRRFTYFQAKLVKNALSINSYAKFSLINPKKFQNDRYTS